jgi:hypothetical protein
VHCGRGPLAYDEATNPSNGWETPQASATEQEQRDGFWIVLFDAAAPGDRLPTFDSREAAVAAIKSAEQATDGNVSGRAVRFADAWDAAQAGNLS